MKFKGSVYIKNTAELFSQMRRLVKVKESPVSFMALRTVQLILSLSKQSSSKI